MPWPLWCVDRYFPGSHGEASRPTIFPLSNWPKCVLGIKIFKSAYGCREMLAKSVPCARVSPMEVMVWVVEQGRKRRQLGTHPVVGCLPPKNQGFQGYSRLFKVEIFFTVANPECVVDQLHPSMRNWTAGQGHGKLAFTPLNRENSPKPSRVTFAGQPGGLQKESKIIIQAVRISWHNRSHHATQH